MSGTVPLKTNKTQDTLSQFEHRVATTDDIPGISGLMSAAIDGNMAAFLSTEQIHAVRESMGVDRLLIDDGTYFIIEAVDADHRTLVACGGWSLRRTLFGGDETVGRDDTFSDPATEPARIRAMYSHPAWIRRGLGSLLLDLGEAAARDAGFSKIELGSTIPGEPLYLARGYTEVERLTRLAANGLENVVIRMAKAL